MSAKIFLKDIEELGRVLKAIRESKQLTQCQVADMAGIGIKHLRDIEKGRYSAGIDLFFLVCEALEVNRILVFSLAFKADAREFIKIANKLLTDDEALTDDELTAYTNIVKSLRAESTKKENISTRGLLGGDKSAIITIKIYIRKKINRTITYIHHSKGACK